MLVTAIILSVLLLLALLRIGLIIIYNENGLSLWVKIGFLRFEVKDTGKIKKRRKKRRSSFKDMKPGSLHEFIEILKIFKTALQRLRRKLLIKKLVLRYVSAGDDPAKAAIGYGAANAVFGIIVPVLDRNFRIKHRELSSSVDYDSTEPGIYAQVSISLAVWESLYILGTLLKIFTVIDTTGKTRKDNAK